jgi:acetyltransferase-like isoleucine patch superfamily enzyme
MSRHPFLDVESFFDLSEVSFSGLFRGVDYVWEALTKRDAYIQQTLDPNANMTRAEGVYVEDPVQIGKGTTIEPGAYIKGPTIIGNHCEIRHGAYIRGNVIIGDHCVIGHTTEVIRSIILNHVRADHFAYIGDSILGNDCHLGAGVILANVKMRMNPSSVRIPINGQSYDTGMRKLGAVLGDRAEIGFNSTLNPGTILGKGVMVYPGVVLRGSYPPKTVIKASDQTGMRLASFRREPTRPATAEQIVCQRCGEPIASTQRVEEMIAYCNEFLGQCSCGQKYHIATAPQGGIILFFPDTQFRMFYPGVRKRRLARARPSEAVEATGTKTE